MLESGRSPLPATISPQTRWREDEFCRHKNPHSVPGFFGRSQVAAITLFEVYMLRAKVSCRNILLPYISKGRIKKFESDIPEKRD